MAYAAAAEVDEGMISLMRLAEEEVEQAITLLMFEESGCCWTDVVLLILRSNLTFVGRLIELSIYEIT